MSARTDKQADAAVSARTAQQGGYALWYTLVVIVVITLLSSTLLALVLSDLRFAVSYSDRLEQRQALNISAERIVAVIEGNGLEWLQDQQHPENGEQPFPDLLTPHNLLDGTVLASIDTDSGDFSFATLNLSQGANTLKVVLIYHETESEWAVTHWQLNLR